MYVTSVAAATFATPVTKTSKAQIEEYQKDIKTLKSFKDLLNKEAKAVSRSKMDRDFKQDAIEQLGVERNLVDDKIQQLTAAVKDQKNLKNGNQYANAGVVTVASYGVSYLA
jgi:hypothetical protein